jgi:hypothetical protein
MSWALPRRQNLNPIYIVKEAMVMDDETVSAAYDSREDTLRHKEAVSSALRVLVNDIVKRSIAHDDSKLEPPEKEYFDKYTPKLKDSTYLSDEYRQFLLELKPALDHHYANNRHHPERFPSGVNGMTLVDIVEMFADWYAASRRHDDGDILKSIELNKNRFQIGDLLANIFKNTALYYYIDPDNHSELRG